MYAIINIGCDSIKTNVDLNLINENLKKLLSNEKYMPLYNNLVSFLFSYNRSTDDVKNYLTKNYNVLNMNNLEIHKRYQDMLSDIDRALTISINKNLAEIDKANEDSLFNIDILQKEIATLQKVHKENIELAEVKYKRAVNDAESVYKSELSQIEIEIDELREDYRIYNLRQENDRIKRIEKISNDYEKTKANIIKKIEERKEIVDNEIDLLKKQIEEQTKNTDESFVTIKTTHTQTSIRLNDFINEAKIKSDETLKSLKKAKEFSIYPCKIEREKKYQKFQAIEQKIQDDYAEKLKALNVVFDVQKLSYNEKTQSIIQENNAAVSKINHQLTMRKNDLENQKLILKKNLDKDLKNALSEQEKSLINREYNKKLKQINKKMANIVKKNLKELKEQQLKFQTNLYNHDVEHIKQINEWRYTKNLYDYKKNQQLMYEEMKFQYEIFKIDEKENNISLNSKIDEYINTYKLNKDLLPIETQLVFASFLQDREINILNTEIESFKSISLEKENKILNKFLFDEIKYNYDLKIAELKKDFELNKINVTAQLELEQARQKRDHQLNVLNLNKDIQKELFDTAKYIELTKLEAARYQENLALNNLDVRLNYETKVHKQESLIEFEKRQTIIHEIKIKHQKLINNRKSQRTIQTAEQYSNFHHQITKLLFNDLYDLYLIEQSLNGTLKQLYKEISEPEIFKETIDNVLFIYIHINKIIDNLLDYFTSIDKEQYNKKISDATDHKYRLKHQEILDLYNQSMDQVLLKKEEILKQKEFLEEQLASTENKLIRNNFVIGTYKRAITSAQKNNDRKTVQSHKDTIKNFKSENRALNKKLRRNARELDRLKIKVRPLNKALTQLEKKQIKEEKNLNFKRDLETLKYSKLLEKHLNDYSIFKKYVDAKFDLNYRLINDLLIADDLTDEVFENLIVKLENTHTSFANQIVNFQQNLLKNYISLYNITLDEQTNLLNNFNRSTDSSIEQINIAHKKFIANEEKDKLFLSKIYLDETSRNNELIRRSQQNSIDKIKTADDNYKNYYKNIEDSIIKSRDNMIKSRDIIAENLSGVLTDLENELNNEFKKSKQQYKLDRNNKLKEIAVINNNIDSIERRNMLRTNAIIDRYNRNKDKQLKTMANNSVKYRDLINKLNNDKQININNSRNEQKLKLKDIQKFKRNMPLELKSYSMRSKFDQNKITNKEKRTLKRSYKFKIKQIRANKK